MAVSPMWNVPVPGSWGPPDRIVLFDDFVLSASAASTALGGWRATNATQDMADEAGGAAVITPHATLEGCFQTNHSQFSMPARGKRLYYETRLKLADSDGIIQYAGLTGDDQTPLTALVNGIGFSKAAAAAVDVLADVSVGSSQVLQDTGVNFADATYVKLAFEVFGEEKVRFYVNGTFVHSTTVIPVVGTLLRPNFAMALDAGTADTQTIDYVFVMQDR